jgi:hypothetical protein
MKTTRFVLLGVLLFSICHGQITIVDFGATGNQINLADTYTQNFDSLLATTPSSGVPWVNNTTLAGWYSSQNTYTASYTTSALLSLGAVNDIERALGSRGSNWALRLVNNSSQTITGFNISYTGEQWYRGANDPQSLDRMFFDYQKHLASTSEATEIALITGAGRVFVPDLYFIAPNRTDVSASVLDGNLTENRYFVSYTLNSISLAPGEKLWLSWSTGDTISFNDHTLAIDDVSISFLSTIPEPAAFATFASAAVFGVTLIYRRRRLAITGHS